MYESARVLLSFYAVAVAFGYARALCRIILPECVDPGSQFLNLKCLL